MDMMNPNGQQPAPGGDQSQDSGGSTVCIAKQADGTFLVYPEAAEGGEPSDQGQDQAGGKTCKTIDEALNAARDLLTGDDGGMSVEQAFQGGFKGSDVGPGAGY